MADLQPSRTEVVPEVVFIGKLVEYIVAGKIPGRERPTQTIFYDMMSAGIQFAAVGRLVYDRAKDLGLGVPIPGDWFLQDH